MNVCYSFPLRVLGSVVLAELFASLSLLYPVLRLVASCHPYMPSGACPDTTVGTGNQEHPF